MRRVIDFLILVAGTFYLAIIYNSGGLIFLGYIEIFLILMLFIYNVAGMFFIDISLEAPLGITECGKKVPLKIKIKNYSSLPTGKISVQLVEAYAISGKKKKTVFYASAAGKKFGQDYGMTVIHAEWKPGCTGKVDMRIRRVRCFDLLGVIALPLPSKAFLGAEVITVLPSVYQASVEVGNAAKSFAAEQERYLQNSSGEADAEAFRIREYQPGDRIRSVHWKLSAKENELMVKEYQPSISCPVLFFLDMSGEVKRWERRREAKHRECFFSVVMSVSRSMVRNDCKHYIIWYDGVEQDVLRFRVEKEEDIYTLLMRIHVAEKLPEHFSLEEEYYQKYRERSYVTKLVLNRKLQLACNGERVISYQQDEIKKSLAAQTIYL